MDVPAGHSPAGGGRLFGSNIGSSAATLRDLKAIFVLGGWVWGGVSWLQAAPTSLVSPYRYIHRCIYSYNAIAVEKVPRGFCNPPVTNRIPSTIATSIML